MIRVTGTEAAAADLMRETKARMDALPEGDPRREILKVELRDLGILKNGFELERIKEESEWQR